MKRRMLFTLALAAMTFPAVSASAAPKTVGVLKEGTPVEFVGQISSEPKGSLNERKMQIAIGADKIDYTLHMKQASMWGLNGAKVDEDAMQDKAWVHGFGWVMDDPRRIQVNTLSIVAGESAATLAGTRFARGGRDQGWLRANGQVVAAERLKEGASVVLVAEISSQPNNLKQEKKMQVKLGADQTAYTLHLSDAVLVGTDGKTLDTNDLVDRMWIRAEGHAMKDDHRIHVTRLVVLGMDSGEYRSSPFFRAGHEQGYLLKVSGERQGAKK